MLKLSFEEIIWNLNFSEFNIRRQKLTGLVAKEYLMLNYCAHCFGVYCSEDKCDSVIYILQGLKR